MGAQGLVDVAVKEGQVHQVLFASLLGEGPPCLVLLLPRLLRVYTLSRNGGPPRGGGPTGQKGAEGHLRFLCEMDLGAPALSVSVIPCSGKGNTAGGPRGPPDDFNGEPPLGEDGALGAPFFPIMGPSAAGCPPVVYSGARGPPDLLLLLFGGYKAVICYYEPTVGALATLSMHSFAELGPRAAAVNSFLMGPPHIKLADEGPPPDANDETWGPQGALTVAAGQLPVSALRSVCKTLVFDLEPFCAGAPLGGPYGAPQDPNCKGYLAMLSVDLLHVVCLHLSIKTEGGPPSSAAAAANVAAAAVSAQGENAPGGPHGGPLSPLLGPSGSPWMRTRTTEGPPHLQLSPGVTPHYPPSLSAATAAAAGKGPLGGAPTASPWSPEGGPSSSGAPHILEKGSLVASAGPLGAPGPSSLSAIPPVAFLAAAVQRQQQEQQQQAADEVGSLGDVTGGSGVSEHGEDAAGGPSLWGSHNVLGQGLFVSSCFFMSLVDDLPLPPAAAAALAAAAAPTAAAVAGDSPAAAAAAAAAATSAAAAAGAAGLPYVLLDMVAVSSLLSPAVALLLAEGPRELGLLPFAGAPGAGEVFSLLLAVHPEEQDIQILAKVRGFRV